MRQAYYGAVDMVSGVTHYVPYDKADALSTTDFLCDLQWRFPHTKLTIIWDNASHHKAGTVREYLAQVNADRPEQDWTITCLWFAPHDPSQNPIELIFRPFGRGFMIFFMAFQCTFEQRGEFTAVTVQSITSCPAACGAPTWAAKHAIHVKSMSNAHGIDGKPL
jgi:transposase